MLTRSRTRSSAIMSSTQHPTFAAADSIPGPGAFDGRSDGLDWLRKFELWSRCRQFSDDTMLAAIQLYFVDAAATWSNVLDDDQKDSWTHFRAAFVERFVVDKRNALQRTGQLWTIQQRDGEPVVEYVDRVRAIGRDCNASDDLLLSSAVNGMRSSLRRRVIHKNPTDLHALLDVSTAAEHDERLDTDNGDTDAIRRIEQRLDRLTLHLVSADKHSSSVRFRDRSASPDDHRRQSSPVAPSTSRYSRRERLGAEMQSTSYRSPSPADRHPSVRSPYAGRRVTFDTAVDRRPASGVRSSRAKFPPCDSCGRTNHRRDQCYFRWAECTSCRRVGHTSSVCRSASH